MLATLLTLGGTFLLLLGWRHAPEPLQGWLFVPIWAFASLLILLANFEYARMRRAVWLAQYLNEASPWRQRLHYGVLAMLLQLLLSVALAMVLLVKLLVVDGALMYGLAAGIVLMLWLSRSLRGRLQSQIKPHYLPIVARRLAVVLSTVLLGLLLIAMLLWLPQPPLEGLSWSRAISLHLGSAQAHGVLGALQRAGELLDLSQKWLLQNTVGGVRQSGMLALLGWIVAFSSYFALSLAFSRLLAGAEILAGRWRRNPDA